MRQHQRSPRMITDWLEDATTVLATLQERARSLAQAGAPAGQDDTIAAATDHAKAIVRLEDPEAW